MPLMPLMFSFVVSTKRMNARNKENCLFAQIPGDAGSFQIGFGFQKKFPYASLKQSNENGQMNRILNKWTAKPRADCASGSGFDSMGIENVISAFAVVALGLLVSIIVLSVEFYKRKSHKIKKGRGNECESDDFQG